MYHRDIKTLPNLGKELVYIDEFTREERTGIVMKVEQIEPNVVFVYIASTRKEENDKVEGTILYRDIFVFDDLPNEIGGFYKDTVLGEFSKYIKGE